MDIANAFAERGWKGFEEAFDSTVPRTSPDYEHVKRDLLREATFSPEVHRRVTLTLTGKMDFEGLQRELDALRKQRVE